MQADEDVDLKKDPNIRKGVCPMLSEGTNKSKRKPETV